MTKLRTSNPVLVYGKYDLLDDEHPDIYAFTRTLDDEKILVLLNFSQDTSSIQLPGMVAAEEEPLINNYPSLEVAGNTYHLAAYQAVIIKIK